MEGKTEDPTYGQDNLEMSEELTTNAKSEEKPLLQQELSKENPFSNAFFVHKVTKKPADLTDDLLKCSRFCNEVICSHKTVYGDHLGFEEDTKVLWQMIGMEFNLNGKEVIATDDTPEHEQYSQEHVLLMKDNKSEDPPTKHRQANCLDKVDRDYKQQIYGLQTSAASLNSTGQTSDDGSSFNVSEDQNEDHNNSSSSIGSSTQHRLNNNDITNANRKKKSCLLANQIQRVLNSEEFKYYYDSNSNAIFSDSDIPQSLNNTNCNDKQGNPSFCDNLNNNGNRNCDQKIPKNLQSQIILNQARYKSANQQYRFTNPQQYRFTNPNPQQYRLTNPQQYQQTNPQQYHSIQPHRFTSPHQYRFANPQQNKYLQQYQSTNPEQSMQHYKSTNPQQKSIQQYQPTNPQQNQPTNRQQYPSQNHEQYQSTNPPHFEATNHSQYPSRRLPYTAMFQTQNKNSTPQNCTPQTHNSSIPQPHESILRELAAMQTNSSFKHHLPTIQPQYLPTTQPVHPHATKPQDPSTTLQQDLSTIEAHHSILESLQSAMFPCSSPELQFPGGQNPPLIPDARELTYEDFERICLGLGLYSLQRQKLISDQKEQSDMYMDYQKTWQQRYKNHPAVKPEVDFSDANQANRWGLLQFESYRAGENFYQFNGRAVNIPPPSESRPGPVHITSDDTDDEMDPELLKNITQSESKSNRLLQLDHILNPSYRKTKNSLDRKALRDAFRWRSLKKVNMSSTPNVSRKESEQRQNANGATPEMSPIVDVNGAPEPADGAPASLDGAPGPSGDLSSTRNGASAFPESSQSKCAPQSQVINTPVTSGKSNPRLQSGTTAMRTKPPVGSLFRNAK